jgi:RNA-directed DNA polymerase
VGTSSTDCRRSAARSAGCAGKTGKVVWMKEPYGEGLATHTGPESCVVVRKGRREALTGVRTGWAIEPRNSGRSGAPTLSRSVEGNTGNLVSARGGRAPRGQTDPTHVQIHLAREPGDPMSDPAARLGPRRESSGSTTPMDGRGKSDTPIVPKKPTNKDGGAPPPAELVEGRGVAEGNRVRLSGFRTQCRVSLPSTPNRIRWAASQPTRHLAAGGWSARRPTRGRSPVR